jgi:hypothetical protein
MFIHIHTYTHTHVVNTMRVPAGAYLAAGSRLDDFRIYSKVITSSEASTIANVAVDCRYVHDAVTSSAHNHYM